MNSDLWKSLLEDLKKRARIRYRLSATDAEDVAAESVLAVYSAFKRTPDLKESDLRLRGLARVILNRKVADLVRRQVIERRHLPAVAHQRGPAVTVGDRPDAETRRKSKAVLHSRILDSLSEDERRLLFLRMRGLSYEDIANQIGQGRQITRMRMSRLVAKVADLYGRLGAGN